MKNLEALKIRGVQREEKKKKCFYKLIFLLLIFSLFLLLLFFFALILLFTILRPFWTRTSIKRKADHGRYIVFWYW
jgi:predicted membrane protein